MKEEHTLNGLIYFITKWREEEMRTFKFLRTPLFTAHDGGDVYAGERFYTVLKEAYIHRGVTLPKYTIIARTISIDKRHKFKANIHKVWYFRSESNARYLIRQWKRQDKFYAGGGENMHHNSDIRITFNR